MSDMFGEISGESKKDVRAQCRVAYTINNTQPVISTIIGDQPLFYMDFDYSYEDEEDMTFDAADMGILEGEINTLRSEIENLDQYSQSQARSSDEKVFDFLSDAKIMTASEILDTEAKLEDLKNVLTESRLAKAYMDFAEQHDVSLAYSSQVETAYYDRHVGIILINPVINFAEQLLLATQELRRHWQHRQGALINPLMFHPDNAVLINRVQVADLIASVVRVAWELQLSGVKEAWEQIENSSMADLGRAFAREAFLDFRTINNGQAAAAVFEAWFLSERCRAQDKNLINQMLADYKGYVFDLEEAEQNITPTLIAALGEMPFGKNYLAEHAVTIMDDAIFTEVRDRSNANFLWFIKFERSFRETEQELQTSIEPTVEGVRPSAQKPETQGQIDESVSAGSDAEVLQLFPEASSGDVNQENGDKSKKDAKLLAPKSRSKRTQNQSDNSNVVYIRWSGE